MYDALIALLSSLSIYMMIGVIIGVLVLIGTIKEIINRFIIQRRYRQLEQDAVVVDKSNLKRLFKLDYKEILIGEGIMTPSGKSKRKISVIKDIPTRFAAENNADLSFAIDKVTKAVYKCLKLHIGDEEYFFIIDYDTLNKYILMSETAYSKYKNINQENVSKLI